MFRMRKMMAVREQGENVYIVGVPGEQNGRKIHFKGVTEETFLEIKQHWRVALKTWFWEKLLHHGLLIKT